METFCPICSKPKKEKNKFCSFRCRNINTNKTRNYLKNSIGLIKSTNHRLDESLGKLMDLEVTCSRCGGHFLVKERIKKFPKKQKYHCSYACSNVRNYSEASRSKMSRSHCKDLSEEEWNERRANKLRRKNLSSDDIRSIRSNAGKKGYKTKVEKGIILYDKSLLKDYRKMCRFKFKLKDFDEFDLLLYQKYGTYKAKNYGDNPKGIVRDHMYSVKRGFENKIDPYFLSHPANCSLIRANENQSKNSKCTITLEDLYKRVEIWNVKYGPYPNDRATHLQ